MTSESKTHPLTRAGLPIRRLQVQPLDGGHPVQAETDQLTIGSALGNDLRLESPTVSQFHAEISRRGNRILVRDLGSTNGTAIGPALLKDAQAEVPPGAVITVGTTQLRIEDADVVLIDHGPEELGTLRGQAPVMRRLMGRVAKAAASEVSVLVLGESGTGKELVAQALHAGSARSAEAFVTVDCGALTPSLVQSELFGHEKGAFTGAQRQHSGAFERAHRGTVFLDELGELSAENQSALLGVLERRSIRRVGGQADIPIDVRVISATSRDLLQEVNAGRFRLDLFYRLAVVRIDVPALREHPEDIPLLIEHFLGQENQSDRLPALFDRPAMQRLQSYRWPGNVRELRNVVLGALALGQAPEPLAMAADAAPSPSAVPGDALATGLLDAHGTIVPYRDARRNIVDAFERRYLQTLLAQAEGNVREGARRARMNRSYLIELLRKHGLP